MSDLAAWIAVVVGIAALVVAYVTYRTQHQRTRLEYAVTTRTELVPTRAKGLAIEVMCNGSVVTDPALITIRLVNTGDRPIEVDDYQTNVQITFPGAKEVVSASITGTRPSNYRPDIGINNEGIFLLPNLINPGDMVEVQALTSGLARSVDISARISGLPKISQRKLPYPPGTGPEGELLGFDWFMHYIFAMIPIFAIVAWISVWPGPSLALKALAWLGAILIAFVLNPMYVRRMVRRREMWKPLP